MGCCGLFRSKKSRRQSQNEKPTPVARSFGAASGPPEPFTGGKPAQPNMAPENPPPAYQPGVTQQYNPQPHQFPQIPENGLAISPVHQSPNLYGPPQTQPYPGFPQAQPYGPGPNNGPPQMYGSPYQSPTSYGPPNNNHPQMSSYSQPQSPIIEPVTRRFSFRQNATVGVDHYSALRNFDTVFLIDDSGSMIGPNWRQTSAALEAIVPICTAHDADGVDIYFLNSPRAHTHIRSSTEVLEIFSAVRPCGATPTGRRLGEILEVYLQSFRANRKIKPLNIIVITDGEPTDPAKLKRAIVDCAKNLDVLGAKDRQVGVQFFQVGNDEAATESLEELDNSLVEEEDIRDMVDTISWKKMNEGKGLSADGILKAVMGAVDKRLDRTQRA